MQIKLYLYQFCPTLVVADNLARLLPGVLLAMQRGLLQLSAKSGTDEALFECEPLMVSRCSAEPFGDHCDTSKWLMSTRAQRSG